MIDIHCHILPGLDDGPLDLRESLLMAEHFSKLGVKKIIATPHFIEGCYQSSPIDIVQVRNKLQN